MRSGLGNLALCHPGSLLVATSQLNRVVVWILLKDIVYFRRNRVMGDNGATAHGGLC